MNSNRKMIDGLRKIANQFSANNAIEKKKFLRKFSSVKLFSPGDLIAYHDCLLFLAAYPQNKMLHEFALKELERLAAISQQINKGVDEKKIEQLGMSGIEGTYLIASFSFDLCEWICKNFPHHVQFYSCDADQQDQLAALKTLLPLIVHNSLEIEFPGIEKWFFNTGNQEAHQPLDSFLKLFLNINNLALRDFLFKALKIFIQVDVKKELWSRTFIRGINPRVFYQSTALNIKIDLLNIVNTPVRQYLKINDFKKQHLLKSARCSLLTLFRETDPITYCDYRETRWYELDNGYHIALFFMVPERRVFPDTFAAYMIYKNNIPVSYGDVLIFMNHARLAFNIYEPYRGSESAYIYCNVMRLFRQHFNIKFFEIEPYQIGFKNDEALQSGSFWFYYKLGFRPVKRLQKTIAESEYKKIMAVKKYRTSVVTLKKLAQSSLQFSLTEDSEVINGPAVSKAIDGMIADKFNGDYNKALTHSRQKFSVFLIKPGELNNLEKQVADNFSLLLYSLPGTADWNEKDKQALYEIIKARASGVEADYITLIQKQERLKTFLVNLLS